MIVHSMEKKLTFKNHCSTDEKGVRKMYEKIVSLTKKLVSIDSRNATSGEQAIGKYLYEYISRIPYFQKHPEQVMAVPLKDDPLGRMNVIAILIGEKDENKDTIILHGHTDTVDVSDYGKLAPYAFDCDKLQEELMKIKETLPEEVRADLESGNYMFGRGTSDMKGGDAVHITVVEQYAEHPEELSGNILLSLNPVEEGLHTGIIEALDTFAELRNKYSLNYLFAINTDFICSAYPGDETRYIYTGSVGKLLPCFYVRGKETHVGQAFEGFDPNSVMAEIVSALNLNCDYCDGYEGEYPAPPLMLKMKDLKPAYSVQTPIASFGYFNYMVHNKNVSEIITELKSIAERALAAVLQKMNDRYRDYCELTGFTYQPIEHKMQVLEYKDLYVMAKEQYEGDLDAYVGMLTKESIGNGDDNRESALKIVEELTDIAGIKIPTVVVFFATPHCPHNTLKNEDPQERALAEKIQKILDQNAAKSGENYKLMHFFPSLTDSSYLKIDDDEASIEALEANFPKQDLLYPVPYKKIYNLNIPGINYGEFGRDAHKWTERVNMDFSFRKLPELIMDTIEYFINQ